MESKNTIVKNALAARNARLGPHDSYKRFGEGVACELDDKGGIIKVTLKVGHGGSYTTGTLAEIKAWRRKQEAKLKDVFSTIDKAEAFAAKWDGKPVESYDA